ncbi:hypothetical protein CC85DRAFT_182654 [Cutaneotrichosporon oleaginosum]|uniref:Uncharacterized protein n=1 Tax=Cutaneotrichosporon oleaginosum TaxID=879819 RepID=A0A0J0XF06_9TREE|nr:uncharacterized protein CC85DRAFT_182654 [Cutaneotrichosporon oleaginosum]KLT39650.1 hypothetical protein CC85DRAFT_182654 [Cutaneotrichosporon oleaginosum]TXT07043.1 hypothetical protein COLE_06374 [Cutaneotrichosporon oleaginosum]
MEWEAHYWPTNGFRALNCVSEQVMCEICAAPSGFQGGDRSDFPGVHPALHVLNLLVCRSWTSTIDKKHHDTTKGKDAFECSPAAGIELQLALGNLGLSVRWTVTLHDEHSKLKRRPRRLTACTLSLVMETGWLLGAREAGAMASAAAATASIVCRPQRRLCQDTNVGVVRKWTT